MPYLRVFHPIWVLGAVGGGGGGAPKGLVHNLLMQFFSLDSSKIEVFETFFLILSSPKMTIQDTQSMFQPVFMEFLPYFMCALLGVESLRGGLAEGNRITSQRLLDQS